MVISSSYFIYVNLVLLILYLTSLIVGYKNGLILQIVDLIFNIVALFVAYFISPILASHFPLVKLDEVYMALNLNTLIDMLIYIVIVFLILKIIYILIKPLFASVSKIPLVGFVNRIGGALVGIINATIIVLLFCMLLNTPIFKNGQDIKNGTYLKVVNNLSYKALEFSMDHINIDLISKEIKDFNIDESRTAFEKWLEEQGILHE